MNKEDKKLIIEIIKDHTKYESNKYKKLEELKVKIKDL